MSDARDRILTSIQRSLRRGPLDGDRRGETERRLSSHPRGPMPARGQRGFAGRLRLFQEMAEHAAATVARVTNWSDVPAAVAAYLRDHNRPGDVRLAPHADLTGLDWASGAPMLTVSEGRGEDATGVGVSRAFAGVAETGTLVLRSGADSPTTLNFLPATHVVVLHASEVAGVYEDVWDRLRAAMPDGQVPRTLNLITGPSRTADIEQTLYLGAHGPMDLHIIVVGDGDG